MQSLLDFFVGFLFTFFGFVLFFVFFLVIDVIESFWYIKGFLWVWWRRLLGYYFAR